MSGDLTRLLDQLDQAHAATTPGPWVIGSRTWHVDAGPWLVATTAQTDADAALIVAAVNHLPALVSAVRAVAGLAEELDAEAQANAPDWANVTHVVANRIRAALAPLTQTEATR